MMNSAAVPDITWQENVEYETRWLLPKIGPTPQILRFIIIFPIKIVICKYEYTHFFD